jgi:Bacterial Ig-like domain (group 1)
MSHTNGAGSVKNYMLRQRKTGFPRITTVTVVALLCFLFSVGAVAPRAAAKSGTGGPDSCVSNGFLTAQVDDSTGVYSFDIGTCATDNNSANYILFPLGTSFVSVNDFTTGVTYTEDGHGGGTSLGVPTSSTVVGNSIVTVFPATQDGLVVTQTITVVGTTAATSLILHNVKVENTNANPQELGIRYLWDTQVGGYDGTWLKQYDGATGGVITGYETDYNPPASTFTSYAMGGCSQGTVVPPPFTCLPSNFGPGSGTFTVFGSISSGLGVTTPARFIYGYWSDMFGSAYSYTSNAANEVGSYVPNSGGSQDSAMLYFFPTQTIPSDGALSDQADITNAQSAVITTGITLAPLTATNPVGGSHTVTATVSDSTGAAVVGVTVTFTVQSGPNAGKTGTGITDPSGKATFTYTDTGGAGTDTIVATFNDVTGLLHTSNTITKFWNPLTQSVPEFGNPAILMSAVALVIVALMVRKMRLAPTTTTS